eukprot:COSAG01_NODE_184_length_22692_cov_155.762758_3_plen_130_part_00
MDLACEKQKQVARDQRSWLEDRGVGSQGAESVFRRMDTDNSGYLDYAEVAQALARLGHGGAQLSEQAMGQTMAAMDSDGDGHVSLGEFLQFCIDANLGAPPQSRRKRTVMTRFCGGPMPAESRERRARA